MLWIQNEYVISLSFRVKKLTETLVTVQQLDKNMNNLRSWLTGIEAELAKPIHYSICHRDEIQKRLTEQQVNLSSLRDVMIFLL
uniref:Uncharacterized protein n=1 Tax=Sinocyclocheilus grahami TaxID=75366 RepID=A0A672MFN1_SINGR